MSSLRIAHCTHKENRPGRVVANGVEERMIYGHIDAGLRLKRNLLPVASIRSPFHHGAIANKLNDSYHFCNKKSIPDLGQPEVWGINAISELKKALAPF